MNHLIRLAALFLICVITVEPGLSKQQTNKQKTKDDTATLRKEIEALKEGQRQILEELQELKRILQTRSETPAAAPPQPSPVVTLNLHGEPFRGNQSARVAIIEYSDFECPYCEAYEREVYPQIDTSYIKSLTFL